MTKLIRTKKVILIAMLSASLTGAKLALMNFANIEVVTLLFLVYSVCFGIGVAFPVSVIFVSCDVLIFGVGYWVILYYIHWGLLAVFASIIYQTSRGKSVLVIAFGILMTAFFGVESSFIDTLFALARANSNFNTLFKVIYLRGVSFYITHIVSNAIIIPILFYPLKELFEQLKKSYFQNTLLNR